MVDCPTHWFDWSDETHVIEYGKHDLRNSYETTLLHEYLHALFHEAFPLRIPDEYRCQSWQKEAAFCKEFMDFLDCVSDLFVNSRMMQLCPEETRTWILAARDELIDQIRPGMPSRGNMNTNKAIVGFYFAQSARLLKDFEFPQIHDIQIQRVYDLFMTAPTAPAFDNLYDTARRLFEIFDTFTIHEVRDESQECWEVREVSTGKAFLRVEVLRGHAWRGQDGE